MQQIQNRIEEKLSNIIHSNTGADGDSFCWFGSCLGFFFLYAFFSLDVGEVMIATTIS